MLKRALKWLYPGIGVKRWLLLAAVGLLLILLGGGLLWGWQLLNFIEGRLLVALYILAGESYPRALSSGLMFFVFGLVCVSYGVRGAVRAMIKVFLPEQEEQLVDLLYERNLLSRAPRLVVIGGGTGMPVLLRGLKELTSNLTAIVTVADDGGSSGRLRGEFGILPPGDIRNCLTALATAEPMLEQLFQHRFNTGSGLDGHSFGNLFIAAMSEITGDFEAAVKESSKVLAVRGRVLPVTLDNIVLCAELTDGSIVCGESNIGAAQAPIQRVFTLPAEAEPLPEALEAIREADAIVLGPGSLYTSVIPNLLIPGVAEAIAASQATKIYVCNVMTQPGETTNYTAADHLKAILDHTRPGLLDCVLVNTAPIDPELLARYEAEGAAPVAVDIDDLKRLGVSVAIGDLISQEDVVRHDSQRLARAVFRLVLRSTLRQEGRRFKKRYLIRMKDIEF
ncbi:MAG TPA: YvcK family protein [Firmicutes bacterium]|nr:YvcK family protein [Bacillota bacterium]